MQLNLINKPEREIITLEETKNYLRVDHDFDDTLILNFITSTREAIEAIIQKSIIKQTWEYQFNTNSICNFYFGTSNYPSILGNLIRIPLPKPPVIDIVSLYINDKVLNNKKYFLENSSDQFCLCINNANINISKRNIIKVIYNAGMSSHVENIPYQLKLANLMLVANAYQERFSYKQQGIISQGIKQLLSPFLNLRIF